MLDLIGGWSDGDDYKNKHGCYWSKIYNNLEMIILMKLY